MDSEKEIKQELDESFEGDGQIELLDYETKLLVDTVDDDVLFITARGLGIERLFLNHLIMYSDQKLLYLVLNTNPHDEAYFIQKLKDSGLPCPPKLITAEVLAKDRQALYLSGGVQFITSRILLVDFLTNNVPSENVAGILVYRAHQVLNSFQESFIIRLYREQKKGGFVKAFTEFPTSLSSLGQLQRAVDRLYVKKVVILPRFHEHVRDALDQVSVTEWNVALPPILRRVQNAIYDLIKVCMRELKQCSYLPKVCQDESESTIGVYAYMITSLERQLLERRSFLSDKQNRVLADLELLRELLRIAEDLDMGSLLERINELRADKEFLEKSSGWILSTTAGKMITDIETMCGSDKKPFLAPPKWNALEDILNEIKNMEITAERVGENGPSVLVFASNDLVCRQLSNVITHGRAFAEYLVQKNLPSCPEDIPEKAPIWDPDSISLFMRSNMNKEERNTMKSDVQKNQIVLARAERKRRKAAEDLIGSTSAGKQTNLLQFGILHHKKIRASQGTSTDAPEVVEVKDEPLDEDDIEPQVVTKIKDMKDVPLIISPLGEKYNTLRFLEEKKPTVVILYNSDLTTIRQLEIYRALNEKLHFVIHQIQYSSSTEEERYLTSINNETRAFEAIVREKGTLLIPRNWDVSRDEVPTLSLSSRDGGGRPEEDPDKRPIVIVDMREFNSELPTILYKKGFDIEAVTLEIGDYVLTPGIAVERKALDDLTQSLQSGRVFKQIEQMLTHYPNTFLLVESSRRFEAKIVNGGPFQGELTRHCRDIRALLCSLVRAHPQMKLLWSISPQNSAEYFAELKISREQPDVDKAVSLRSGEVNLEREATTESSKKKSKPNALILRNLSANLPSLAKGDVTAIMLNSQVTSLKDLLTMSATNLHAAIGHHADKIYNLAHFDFSQNT